MEQEELTKKDLKPYWIIVFSVAIISGIIFVIGYAMIDTNWIYLIGIGLLPFSVVAFLGYIIYRLNTENLRKVNIGEK